MIPTQKYLLRWHMFQLTHCIYVVKCHTVPCKYTITMCGLKCICIFLNSWKSFPSLNSFHHKLIYWLFDFAMFYLMVAETLTTHHCPFLISFLFLGTSFLSCADCLYHLPVWYPFYCPSSPCLWWAGVGLPSQQKLGNSTKERLRGCVIQPASARQEDYMTNALTERGHRVP